MKFQLFTPIAKHIFHRRVLFTVLIKLEILNVHYDCLKCTPTFIFQTILQCTSLTNHSMTFYCAIFIVIFEIIHVFSSLDLVFSFSCFTFFNSISFTTSSQFFKIHLSYLISSFNQETAYFLEVLSYHYFSYDFFFWRQSLAWYNMASFLSGYILLKVNTAHVELEALFIEWTQVRNWPPTSTSTHYRLNPHTAQHYRLNPHTPTHYLLNF